MRARFSGGTPWEGSLHRFTRGRFYLAIAHLFLIAVLGSVPATVPRPAHATTPAASWHAPSADETVVFGPERFVRGHGRPQTYTRTFSVPGPTHDCALVVKNGTDKSTRVSSATIDLNGRRIIRESDFNKQATRIERSVAVAHHNTLIVTLNSAPGSFLDVSIECERGRNTPPVANAGPDRTAFVHDTVQLDGSRSSDADGDRLSFRWRLMESPAGSAAALSDPAAVKPTFAVDRPGRYIFELIVNDGKADSAPDTVTVSTENSPPTACAGPDQTVHVGDFVQLNGSGCTDPDGDPLSYRWSFMERPEGSQAALSDPTAVDPSFVVDRFGTYVLQLIANDGQEDSAPDMVTIATEHTQPVANAGPDQTAQVGAAVTLDGSTSVDVDGDRLTYRWSLTSVPPDSAAVLSDAAAVNPVLTLDKRGTYVAQLIVNDGQEDSAPDTVTITSLDSHVSFS